MNGLELFEDFESGKFVIGAENIDLGAITFLNRSARLAGTVMRGRAVSVHPQQAAIAERHRAWAADWNLMPPSKVCELGFERLWTGCLPNHTAEIAAIVSDYCLMFTVLDDLAEGSFEGGVEAGNVADAALHDFALVLAGKRPVRTLSRRFLRYELLLGVVDDVGRRIRANVSSNMYALFLTGFDMYVRGVIQQVHLAGSGAAVSRATQIYNRHLNVAVDPTIAVVCGLAGVEYSMNSHPLFERLHIAITRASAVVNDIISFPKESRTGTTQSTCHNLIAAYLGDLDRKEELDENLTLAVAGVFEFHNDEMRDVEVLGRMLTTADASLERYLLKALEVHQDWMAWCLSAVRYRQT